MKINDYGYDLNTANTSDALGGIESDPYIVTHNSNIVLDQKLFSGRTIRKVSVLPPTMNLRIYAIGMTPQTLLMTEVQ